MLLGNVGKLVMCVLHVELLLPDTAVNLCKQHASTLRKHHTSTPKQKEYIQMREHREG